MPSSAELAALCAADPEFRLHARRWDGGFVLKIGETALQVSLKDGTPEAGEPQGDDVVEIQASQEVWDQVLAKVPPRFLNQLWPATESGLKSTRNHLVFCQRYSAVDRAIELLRAATSGPAPQRPAASPPKQAGDFDSPVGRYIRLDLSGEQHRIYFESAGEGIPLLLQHTAGSHGTQWRHLFEMPEITSRFKLIAYDLPHHGKSVPPEGAAWWARPYKLTKERAMELPVKLAEALQLDRPAFMGCSVGGLLALDLARYHPEKFRAVVAVEPSLKVRADLSQFWTLWDPRISNEFKARMMRGLTAPTSPENLRRETEHTYAAGWPPAFLGDLHYYADDHDLRAEASNIDTEACQVHMLTGEYDASATLEDGRECHAAIRGSTFAEMLGMGHFPMSEDPQGFAGYLMPILDKIAAGGEGGKHANGVSGDH
ncbi:alpha/beta hydrolase fold protein [Hyaloraphidium curvatum]|nr:alpha/beta hydrolase fold protein [Hyaloraphidium curvatum]